MPHVLARNHLVYTLFAPTITVESSAFGTDRGDVVLWPLVYVDPFHAIFAPFVSVLSFTSTDSHSMRENGLLSSALKDAVAVNVVE